MGLVKAFGMDANWGERVLAGHGGCSLQLTSHLRFDSGFYQSMSATTDSGDPVKLSCYPEFFKALYTDDIS